MKHEVVIGVLAVQGDVSEHVTAMEEALAQEALPGKVVLIRHPEDLDKIRALIIPGGESTVISRILVASGLMAAIIRRIHKHTLPIFGTCAGCILLAKKLTHNPQRVQLLNAMDIEVARNAFGRQKESSHQVLRFKGIAKPINAVFIRGPIITQAGNDCEILATLGHSIVAVRQNEFLALAFHPELTTDRSIHKYFLQMLL